MYLIIFLWLTHPPFHYLFYKSINIYYKYWYTIAILLICYWYKMMLKIISWAIQTTPPSWSPWPPYLEWSSLSPSWTPWYNFRQKPSHCPHSHEAPSTTSISHLLAWKWSYSTQLSTCISWTQIDAEIHFQFISEDPDALDAKRVYLSS